MLNGQVEDNAVNSVRSVLDRKEAAENADAAAGRSLGGQAGAAITKHSGKTILASPVSHSRVAEYVPDLWDDLQPRHRDFGIEVPAMTTEQLWKLIAEFTAPEIDLLKLDCEGAEYLILPELARLKILSTVGWLRDEWHSRSHNQQLADALAKTHEYHIDPNEPHTVGLFVGHRR